MARFVVLCLFLSFTLWGCDKDGSLPVEPPIQPKAELTISPEMEVIPFGDVVTIAWKGENSKYGLLNGQKVENFGSVKLRFPRDTAFTFIAVNGSLSSSLIIKSIKVGDWTTSKTGLLTFQKPTWKMKSVKYLDIIDGHSLSESVITDDEKTEQYYFGLDGHLKGWNGSGVQVVGCDWAFLENETRILVGDQNCLLKTLTKDEFTRTKESTYKGKPAILEIKYYRPQ